MNKLSFSHILASALIVLLGFSCNRPIARFTHTDVDKAPAQVKFSNQSEKALTYRWDFGDGNTSTEAEPIHRYNESGNFQVTLYAERDGKVAHSAQRILVAPPTRCLVEIITDYGIMVAELYNETPQHQANFLKLANEGFYDSLLFHRVIKDFMIQGGDPNSRSAKKNTQLGSGGPGYQIPAEFVDSLLHIKGALAAARTGDQVNPQRKSSGSQFYIVQGRQVSDAMLDQLEGSSGIRYSTVHRELYKTIGGTPQLDHNYTVFGRVIDGLGVIDKIADLQTGAGDRPVKDVRMKIRIIR